MKTVFHHRGTLWLMLMAVGVLTMVPERADGIPSFARKYETSCVTCHVGYPKLNSFGEAFRLNGYQYPQDEQEMTKDDPVSLGSDAYKRVFPDAVWPNDIPGKPPVSLRVGSGFDYEKNASVETEFTAPSLNLMAAGTLGDNVGFFAGAHLFEEGETGSIDRAFLQFSSIFDSKLPEKALNLRTGQFIPSMVPFANHRGIALTPYAFNTYSALSEGFEIEHAHGGEEGSFGIEQFQLGLEASGIVRKRARWSAGLVNGSGPGEETSSAKDGYGRLAIKVGGMGLEGSTSGETTAKNWRDDSVSFGIFGYRGSYPNPGSLGPEDLERTRFGFDASLLWSDLNLFGGYIQGSDEIVEAASTVSMEYDLFFTEANYVIFPWLFGLARFEQANPDGGDEIRRVVAGATALFRANIRITAESNLDPDDSEFSNLFLKLDFAM